MVTPAQAQANVRTATAVIARQMGIYVNDGSGFSAANVVDPNQQITLTNAVAQYIKTHPAEFDTGALDLTNPVLSAADVNNSNLQDTSFDYGAFVDDALANARAINPLDPQNIGTVGKYVLGAAVILGGIYLVVTLLPMALAKSKAA